MAGYASDSSTVTGGPAGGPGRHASTAPRGQSRGGVSPNGTGWGRGAGSIEGWRARQRQRPDARAAGTTAQGVAEPTAIRPSRETVASDHLFRCLDGFGVQKRRTDSCGLAAAYARGARREWAGPGAVGSKSAGDGANRPPGSRHTG
jgi:hypothetical protein